MDCLFTFLIVSYEAHKFSFDAVQFIYFFFGSLYPINVCSCLKYELPATDQQMLGMSSNKNGSKMNTPPPPTTKKTPHRNRGYAEGRGKFKNLQLVVHTLKKRVETFSVEHPKNLLKIGNLNYACRN